MIKVSPAPLAGELMIKIENVSMPVSGVGETISLIDAIGVEVASKLALHNNEGGRIDSVIAIDNGYQIEVVTYDRYGYRGGEYVIRLDRGGEATIVSLRRMIARTELKCNYFFPVVEAGVLAIHHGPYHGNKGVHTMCRFLNRRVEEALDKEGVFMGEPSPGMTIWGFPVQLPGEALKASS